MNLPKMATDKPRRMKHQEQGSCNNHLHQEFNQKAPNLVCASDFTNIKLNGKWYYLCIVMDLFLRKSLAGT
jgi:transposase InsO family protein